jgi:hypothetical protein
MWATVNQIHTLSRRFSNWQGSNGVSAYIRTTWVAIFNNTTPKFTLLTVSGSLNLSRPTTALTFYINLRATADNLLKILGKQTHILLKSILNKFIDLSFLLTIHLKLWKCYAATIFSPCWVIQCTRAIQNIWAGSRLQTLDSTASFWVTFTLHNVWVGDFLWNEIQLIGNKYWYICSLCLHRTLHLVYL